MKWLVISDIHFADLGFGVEKLRKTLLEELRELQPHCDFVIVAGDCLYKNDASGDTLQETANFIKDIARASGANIKRIFMCRGNHDIDRFDMERNLLVDEVRKGNYITKKRFEELVGRGSDRFKQLYSLVRGSRAHYKFYEVVSPKGLGARIIKLDTCLLSKDGEDIGKLRVCSPRLDRIGEMIKNDGRINIAFMHHGVGCLHPDDARQLEHWLEDSHVDVVFCGHTHQAAVDYLGDVNREIAQFTSGALMLDSYAIPSFYLCDGTPSSIKVSLYTYATKPERWVRDHHHLRKFPAGTYKLALSRKPVVASCTDDAMHIPDENEDVVAAASHEALGEWTAKRHAGGFDSGSEAQSTEDNLADNRTACVKVIAELNARYFAKYGTRQIVSSKTEEREGFEAWKIVNSLASVGVPYPDALRLACEAVVSMTSDKYSSDNILSSTQIKRVIYETILESCAYLNGASEYEVGLWASVYARHYDKEVGFRLLDGQRAERLSYSLLRDSLLREAVVKVTGNSLDYDKAYSSEKKAMAEHVMRFVKSLGIFEIRKEPLLEFIAEYMTERPHPWFVTRDRDGIVKYHLRHADEHLRKVELDDERVLPVLQIEIAYHVCAALLAKYDEYTGCTESSPISILHHALRRLDQKDDIALPMYRYRLIQMEKDLTRCGVETESLVKNIDLVYRHVVKQRVVTDEATLDALRMIRETIDKLPLRYEHWDDAEAAPVFGAIVRLFEDAEGFKVKAPLEHFDGDAFFVEPFWGSTITNSFNLGSSLLVCMLHQPDVSGPDDCENIAIGYEGSPSLI